MVLICKSLSPIHPRILMPNLVKIGPVVLEIIFRGSLFSLLFLTGKGRDPSFEQT